MRLFKVIGFLITLAFFYIAAIPLHEWCHYVASNFLGGQGSVTYPSILGGFYEFTTMPSHPWIVYLAGGLGVGLIYFGVWWFQFKSPSRWDMDDEFSLALIGATQAGYGIGELMWGMWNLPFWTTYIWAIAGAAPVIIIYTPRVMNWILQTGEDS